ncbi:proton-conducting transporter transmembrane domain-containing protein [Algoriphagus pacificus]|uniref:Probable inorganic carbon transporter subunit DabB n=1 Tax=Algoriphagus pacificus TaxID=2811234 RepID=A0ABS3CFY6_9BACT|nr:proton-conducting transporter membrane subunit [Algoriphagus pacificus]MBN7814554.1 NADH/ubiquinone/plastoquinone (complex i) [Algoriphagus pacificus]
MNHNLLSFITLISPVVFILTVIVSWFQPGIRPIFLKKLATVASILSISIAAISGFFVAKYSLLETPMEGLAAWGFVIRLDVLSILMLNMIALLGFIVIRFSLNYLDGDARQGVFIGRLASAIASVQLLVLSGHLGILFISWVLTSMSLHRLLVFYKDRPGAIIAARKKFIVARLGDVSLLAACILLYFQFETGNLEVIFQSIQANLASGISMPGIESVAILLALAAILKSAQFPTHGWLIEVMETPTPVSALLHAGLLNAGPFLIIRMAFVMDASSYAPLILLVIGGFTALFASVAFLTQTSIKTALGYSSVAHMGFSLLTCGMGVYPAAMLHLVAHSFYKAHSFLSSGSVIEVIRASKVKDAKRIGSPFRILLGILLALGLYTAVAMIWGIDPQKELALLGIGGVIILGLSRLFSSAIDSDGGKQLILKATGLSVLVTLSFFSLESGAHFLLSSQIPELIQPTLLETVLIGMVLVAFGGVVLIQILAPKLSSSPAYLALAIHLRNGLYINTLFDRIVRSLYTHKPKSQPIYVTKPLKQESKQEKVFEKSFAEVS